MVLFEAPKKRVEYERSPEKRKFGRRVRKKRKKLVTMSSKEENALYYPHRGNFISMEGRRLEKGRERPPIASPGKKKRKAASRASNAKEISGSGRRKRRVRSPPSRKKKKRERAAASFIKEKRKRNSSKSFSASGL